MKDIKKFKVPKYIQEKAELWQKYSLKAKDLEKELAQYFEKQGMDGILSLDMFIDSGFEPNTKLDMQKLVEWYYEFEDQVTL